MYNHQFSCNTRVSICSYVSDIYKIIQAGVLLGGPDEIIHKNSAPELDINMR